MPGLPTAPLVSVTPHILIADRGCRYPQLVPCGSGPPRDHRRGGGWRGRPRQSHAAAADSRHHRNPAPVPRRLCALHDLTCRDDDLRHEDSGRDGLPVRAGGQTRGRRGSRRRLVEAVCHRPAPCSRRQLAVPARATRSRRSGTGPHPVSLPRRLLSRAGGPRHSSAHAVTGATASERQNIRRRHSERVYQGERESLHLIGEIAAFCDIASGRSVRLAYRDGDFNPGRGTLPSLVRPRGGMRQPCQQLLERPAIHDDGWRNAGETRMCQGRFCI
jgi:hypothetical protein